MTTTYLAFNGLDATTGESNYKLVTTGSDTNQPTKNKMTTYEKRFNAAYKIYIADGAPPSAARDLAHEQITWEDDQANETFSLGLNDSIQLHSY